jgi:hypothetical protein
MATRGVERSEAAAAVLAALLAAVLDRRRY